MTFLAAFSDQDPPVLYHYTSMEAFTKIVSGKKVWAGNIRYMNDTKEFDHAISLAHEMVKQKLKSAEDSRERGLYATLTEMLPDFIRPDIYVFCLTEQGDLLSQWRGYCPNGVGFSFGFESKTLEAIAARENFRLERCIYDQPEQIELITSLLSDTCESLSVAAGAKNEEFQIIQEHGKQFIDKLQGEAPRIKHYKFKEEEEWRLISSQVLPTDERINVRAGNSTLKPYMEVDIRNAKDELQFAEVIISPTPDTKLAVKALGILFKKYDVQCEVKSSEIPYRSW